MLQHRNTWALVASTVLLASCASSGSAPQVRGKEIRVEYAEVIAVERVKMPSAAPAGAMVGGFTGLVLGRKGSTGGQIASGVGGAAVGALAARALEGDRLGYSYHLRFNGGAESKFITEKGYLRVDDCVSVETGEFSNLRRVNSDLCNRRSMIAPEPTHLYEAEQCHEAKKLLLMATTRDETDSAAKKVEILCKF